MKLTDFKAAFLGLRALHRIYLQLKRWNDNYELLHEYELAQARTARADRAAVAKQKAKFYYQSDQAVYEEELKDKIRRLAESGELTL